MRNCLTAIGNNLVLFLNCVLFTKQTYKQPVYTYDYKYRQNPPSIKLYCPSEDSS